MSFLGTQELLVILVVALLVVGPKRLPDLAKNLGKGIRNFKSATAKMRSELDESGAMDEINELKAHVQGLRDDVKSVKLEIPELTSDAATSPRQEDAPAASAPDSTSSQVLDALLDQPITQTGGAQNTEIRSADDSDDPLMRILGGNK